ncbi:MAG: hypothetical protein R3C71_11400 [Candidatus Krumholzibacteriia bacterium]|nr:hypothetical protein [bacterium]MCB9514390.1 hypothetical protein [Candidatus Latescibacterota bacterium]MCB9516673.1 hypothetical protein [Candidatus Latescibacterota bacterium]
MNCPRCTQGIPADASYCPHCGLDLSTVQREPAVPADLPPLPDEPILDGGADAEPDVATDPGSVWPRPLRLHRTRSGKRPFLAATLAFFFGPFAYLYLEQANWFWWGFLGGIFLLFVSRGEVLPLLVLGYVLHSYDVAQILDEEHRAAGAETMTPSLDAEGELG